MPDSRAGVWLVALIIYFGVLITIVYATETLEIEAYNTTIGDADLSTITATNICDNPRYYVDKDGDIGEMPLSQNDNLVCRELGAGLNQIECENVEGCSWTSTNQSSIFFGLITWGTDGYYCSGYVNASHYGITATSSGRNVALHQTSHTVLWGLSHKWSDSACTDDAVLFNQTLCDLFSCNWRDYDYSEDLTAPNLMTAMGDLFSYKYDFGVSNAGLKFMLTLLFVIIPQALVLLVGYFLIR